MSAAEINDARCPDCNAPTIWERATDDDVWTPTRCDQCQQCHDADAAAHAARVARRVDLGNDPDGGLLLVNLDPVATRCLACLEAADLNPWSFEPSDFGASEDPELDWDADSEGLANEDDQYLSRAVFTASGLMGGCYMPAVTYHHARRIREFVTVLQACRYEREAEWGCELPRPEHTDAESLDVWWTCFAIEAVAYAIETACEGGD